MFEGNAIIITAVFGILFLVAPFIVNAFYQRRARRFSDEMLMGNIEEFNRQIRANGVVLLVRRSLWAIFVFSFAAMNYRHFLDEKLEWWLIGTILLGLGCLAFGVLGYQNELKKLKTLE